MRLSRADLDLLARNEEVRIETSLPGGPSHSTIVWVVADGDEAFIRSYRGEVAGDPATPAMARAEVLATALLLLPA